MTLEQNETLIAALRALDTEIIEVSAEQGDYTDPNGRTYEGLPPFVRVAMHSVPGPGSNIRHEIWLPAAWNGCFHGTGNGGMAGGLYYHTLAARMKLGYAVINTDLGTSGGVECGIHNPDVWKDFGWRATYLMTRSGKLVTEAYYGRPIEHSYFWGGSTGGQQAMSLVQRFPEEYDGIIAHVPAHNRTHLHAYFLWGHNTVMQSGAEPFTVELLREVTACAVAYNCAVGHGEPGDLFVDKPSTDAAFIDGFIDYLKDNLPALSCEQRECLRKIYHGPVNPRTGKRIYTGMPIGAESYGSGPNHIELLGWQRESAPRSYPFKWAFGDEYREDEFDSDRDVDRLDDLLAADMNVNAPDLRPFFARGGKLLMYSGSADPIVPFPEAMHYYNRMVDAVGGVEAALDGARFFLIPGQEHRANPTRYGPAVLNGERQVRSPLAVLRLWCEQGIAPDSLTVVTEIDGVQGEKTIYPYCTEKNPRKSQPACDEEYLVQ